VPMRLIGLAVVLALDVIETGMMGYRDLCNPTTE
jgi:hypothetical protein